MNIDGKPYRSVWLDRDDGWSVHIFDQTKLPWSVDILKLATVEWGTALAARELGSRGVPHTVVAENADGHQMQHGEVDLVILGTDRVTRSGDVADIPIEERSGAELAMISGRRPDGRVASVGVTPLDSPSANPAYDVTPARLVGGHIPGCGRREASHEGLLKLFPERR